MGDQVASLRGRLGLRVLIVDPYALCRHAIAGLIEHDAGGRAVVEEAEAVPAAVEAAGRFDPDLVILGFADKVDPEAVAEVLRGAPNARLLVLGPEEDGSGVVEALRAGAGGFVPRSADPSEVLDVLARLARGENVAVHPQAATEALLWGLRTNWDRAPREAAFQLTAREQKVLELLSQGLNATAIAHQLFLSRRTVEFHLANAYRKMGVHGRISAINQFRKRQEVGA